MFTIGITGMPNATTNSSQSKICNPNDQSVNPPLSKMWEIALPSSHPRRIDAPGNCSDTFRRHLNPLKPNSSNHYTLP